MGCIRIIKGDICKMDVDAIVNAANTTLLGGGGVDGAIHRAAGPKLLEECRGFGGCETGEARITAGYDLPARHVIHTPGPVWKGGRNGEPRLLRASYANSMQLAADNGCKTVAFPSISTGVYGYPIDKAARVALSAISAWTQRGDLEVTMVCHSDRDLAAYRNAAEDLGLEFLEN